MTHGRVNSIPILAIFIFNLVSLSRKEQKIEVITQETFAYINESSDFDTSVKGVHLRRKEMFYLKIYSTHFIYD